MDCISVLVPQSCLTLCDPTDCSPPGIFVHEILQARILEWVAIFFLQVIVYDSLFLCVHFLTCGFSIFSGSLVKELILSHSIFFTQLSKINWPFRCGFIFKKHILDVYLFIYLFFACGFFFFLIFFFYL